MASNSLAIPYDRILRSGRALRPWFIGFSSAWILNRLLSRWAENKWLLKADANPWKWNDEVAVITGGSSGMGALVAKGLADKGVKVVVIDIVPLAEDAKKSKCAAPPLHVFGYAIAWKIGRLWEY